jgi:hypothetical protein
VQGFAPDLVHRDENRLPADQSSRGWKAGKAIQQACLGAVLLGVAILFAPVAVITVLSAIAVAQLVLKGLVKGAAALCVGGQTDPSPLYSNLPLPIITLMIPRYSERAIAEHPLTRLEALITRASGGMSASCSRTTMRPPAGRFAAPI